MKIAVLLPGHIRAWEFCKDNFLNTIYDTRHEIDVFVDTYNDIFRNDYPLHDENQMNIIKSNSEVLEMFFGINVVDFKIEPQLTGDPEEMQIRKILRIVSAYETREAEFGRYDLVIRSRCDILLDEPLNYELIYNTCKDTKLVYIGHGAVHMKENDMFAVANTDTFKIYGKRFFECNKVHASMNFIEEKYNVSYSQTVGISIVRLNNKTYTVFK